MQLNELLSVLKTFVDLKKTPILVKTNMRDNKQSG